jgi:glycosyltransferase involved in cell wall biosynthesis
MDKVVVLGVSSFWNKMKGVDFFNRLADDLDEKKFQIVLVGKAEEGSLSDKILHIPATNNIKELCALYTAADVFVNPTLQETQGLTTLEAFACGTPAIVFNSGGAAECVDETCGIVVERGDYQNLLNSVLRVQSGEVKIDKQDCIRVAQKYEAQRLYQDFLELYENIIKEQK